MCRASRRSSPAASRRAGTPRPQWRSTCPRGPPTTSSSMVTTRASRAARPPASSRSMSHCASGSPEWVASTWPSTRSEKGLPGRRSRQVLPTQVSPRQAGASQVSPSETGDSQAVLSQAASSQTVVPPGQVLSTQILSKQTGRPSQVGIFQACASPPQAGAFQAGVSQVCLSQASSSQSGASQAAPSQRGASQTVSPRKFLPRQVRQVRHVRQF